MARSIKEWNETLVIFEKYSSGDKVIAGAEHDCIYAGLNPDEVTEADIKALDDLGWIVDEDNDGFYMWA